MKNKGVTYVLAIFVVIIWGTIIYRIFYQKDDVVTLESVNVSELSAKSQDQVSDYQLRLDYSDPFHVYASKKTKSVVTSQEKNRTYPQKGNSKPHSTFSNVQNPIVAWPQIKYGGLIISSNNRTAIININGKSGFFTEGQSFGEVTITSITAESITVTYKNQSKTIKK